ncbi:undecaprenyl-diphosphatase [Paucidesulfovibrio gracilis DSM 16080]|uniref:Undecaprenyl-diphosphatase n=1 Tax=Paucidesulfovibrio gracilis DSM 16080 TaxID=1121449 RepID=A0A1T4X6H7_9BACT|nr:phosphatase PAP2 family protein [Paucidesulfovibrio gracilis]SKA84655.1 undecaprenyl-diphosphatase [Paucidesulfovibrio gracilis DSM 16080]
MFFDTPAFDLWLFELINQHWHVFWLNGIMRLLSSKTLLFLLFVPAALLTARRLGRRQLILFVVLLAAMGLTDLTTSMVKDSIQRVRPLNSLPNTHFVEDGQWQQRPADFVSTKTSGSSYPSAHASNSMCLATLALLFWGTRMRQGLRTAVAALPFLVGYSRLYLGKHFPSDILAGWLYGMVLAILVWLIWKYLLEQKITGGNGMAQEPSQH